MQGAQAPATNGASAPLAMESPRSVIESTQWLKVCSPSNEEVPAVWVVEEKISEFIWGHLGNSFVGSLGYGIERPLHQELNVIFISWLQGDDLVPQHTS